MTVRLLPGERLETELRPAPLAWLSRYFIGGYPALLALGLALVFHSAWWASVDDGPWYQFWNFLYGNSAAAYVYMFVGLALMGAIIAVAAIRWRTFFAYIAIGLGTVALGYLLDMAAVQSVPLGLVILAMPMLIMAELDRRSHKYVLTNLRIIFQGGTFVRKERQLKYEAITDLDGTQGVLGRMFNFGTLIPVTQSGFGLGADSSEAGITVGGGASRGGVFGGAAVNAGGGKEVSTGRAKTFHQLTGISPYGDSKFLLERLVQEATSTPYLREQVELQREMVGALRDLKAERSTPEQ
jgi:membrane protein YdbS with pleckstrin-like domain